MFTVKAVVFLLFIDYISRRKCLSYVENLKNIVDMRKADVSQNSLKRRILFVFLQLDFLTSACV